MSQCFLFTQCCFAPHWLSSKTVLQNIFYYGSQKESYIGLERCQGKWRQKREDWEEHYDWAYSWHFKEVTCISQCDYLTVWPYIFQWLHISQCDFKSCRLTILQCDFIFCSDFKYRSLSLYFTVRLYLIVWIISCSVTLYIAVTLCIAMP